MMYTSDCTIDFDGKSSLDNWQIVNDGVMGGLSRGRLSTDSGSLVFEGDLSLENNGGFSWAQHRMATKEVSNVTHIKMLIKTHGHSYQLTARSKGDRRFHFESVPFSSDSEWKEVVIQLSDLQKTWRGRSFDEFLSSDDFIEEIGFIVKDGTPGAFRLEVKCITFD